MQIGGNFFKDLVFSPPLQEIYTRNCSAKSYSALEF